MSGSRYLSVVGVSQLDYLSQTVATVVRRSYRLSFWLQVSQRIVATSTFAVQLQPAPTVQASVPALLGDANASLLRPGSAPGSFSFTATKLVTSWTRYELQFVAAGPSTTIRLGFRGRDGLPSGSTEYAIDAVSVTSGGC